MPLGGEGAILDDGFWRQNCRSADALIVHIMMQRSTEYGQQQTFSQRQNGNPMVAAVDRFVTGYAPLRLAMPIKPSRPEPKSQIAAGSGTAPTNKESVSSTTIPFVADNTSSESSSNCRKST